jgi:membrane protease YdiL (CAAX protease family)
VSLQSERREVGGTAIRYVTAANAVAVRMSALPPPTTAPAGWYPDPYTGGVRYFDGRAWTGPSLPAVPGTTPTLPPLAPRTEHPKLPFQAAAGALVVLTVSLIVGKLIVEALVDRDWPLVVYIVLAATISYGPSIGWGLYVRRRWGAGRLAALGWRPRWSDLGWGPLTWLAAVVSQALMAAIILATDIPFTSNIDQGELDSDRTYVIALLAAAVIAAPIVEEMVFRGLVLRGFLSRMHAGFAIPLQGILFGAAHFDPSRGIGNVGLLMVLSTVGVVLGLSAFVFRRLGPPMLAHAILNGVALAIALSGWLDDVESPFELLL